MSQQNDIDCVLRVNKNCLCTFTVYKKLVDENYPDFDLWFPYESKLITCFMCKGPHNHMVCPKAYCKHCFDYGHVDFLCADRFCWR